MSRIAVEDCSPDGGLPRFWIYWMFLRRVRNKRSCSLMWSLLISSWKTTIEQVRLGSPRHLDPTIIGPSSFLKKQKITDYKPFFKALQGTYVSSPLHPEVFQNRRTVPPLNSEHTCSKPPRTQGT